MTSEADALADLGRLITSSTDFGEVFEATAESISALIPAETVSIATADVHNNTYTTMFRWGRQLPGFPIGMVRSLAGTAAEFAINQGVPIIADTELVKAQMDRDDGVLLAPIADLKSWIVAPLLVAGNTIGIVHLRTSHIQGYTQRHLDIAERIANQIAGTIAIADLHSELLKSENEQSALARLAVELAEADSAQDMYESIDKVLTEFFKFDRISIVIIDISEKRLTQVYQRGISVQEIEVGTILQLSGSPHEFDLWANELAGTSEGGKDLPASVPIPTHKSLGLESRMRTPMSTHTGYVGAIALNHRQKSVYTETNQNFLRRVASQAAPALEKSFLLEQAETKAKVQQSLARIGLVVARDLDLQRVYERVADELANLMPFDRVAVSHFDQESQKVIVEFAQGIELEGAAPGDVITDPGKTVSWETVGDFASSKPATPAEFEFFPRIDRLGLKSWIQAPLGLQATGPIGFLSVRSKTVDQYDDADLELLKQVAEQITPAIQNARIFEQSTALVEQKERAVALDEENLELQRVADARSQFLSTVSHELRTPLTSISAFSDILSHNRPGNLEARQLTQIDAIKRSTAALTDLVDDLLDVSRADSGRLTINRVPFDFQELIRDYSELAESIVSQKKQEIIVTNLEKPTWITGDKARLVQVLNNLISNASKYSAAETEIHMEVTRHTGRIEVKVQDHGIGIAPYSLDNVFLPFFRADNPETHRESGTGLGLSVVRTLVELHGGGVTIKSESGVGTVVRFWIPGIVEPDSADQVTESLSESG